MQYLEQAAVPVIRKHFDSDSKKRNKERNLSTFDDMDAAYYKLSFKYTTRGT